MKLFPAIALVLLVIINEATFQQVITDDNAVEDQKNKPSPNENIAPPAKPSGRRRRPRHPSCASDRNRACQNFNADVATEINNQIGRELKASYDYMAMGAWFSRDDKALRGFSKFFFKASEEEREHAQKFIDYMNRRGGDVRLSAIAQPSTQDWGRGLDAVQTALRMERDINDKLLDLHYLASRKNDPHLANFLESEFLTEQVNSIKQLSDFIAILSHMNNDAVGEHIFDQELYDGKR